MRLGHEFYRQRKLSKSKDAFSRALQLPESLGASRIQRRHDSTIFLSNVLLELREYPSVEQVHKDFLRSVESEVKKDDTRLAEHWVRLISALVGQGKDKDAEAIREKALRGATPESQCMLWTGIGSTLRSQGKFFEAKEAFGEALKLADGFDIEKVDLRNYATNGFCDVAGDLRDYLAVAPACRDFIHFAEGKLDMNNRRVLSKRYYIATAFHEEGKEKDAEAKWRELASIMRRALKDKKTIWSHLFDNIACADVISRSTTDAAALQDALQVLKEVEGDAGHERFCRSWWHGVAAEIHGRLGQRQEAVRLCRIAWENTPQDDVGTQDGTKK
jgi:tetratricopeptide (TPR) repeat protein